MSILGIDPGSRRIGYGLIEQGAQPRYIAAGLIPITSGNDAGALVELRRELDLLIQQHQPTHVGIERLFFTNNRTTGIAVSQARGVILEYITTRGIPVIELTPNQVKQGITGSGNANKKAVEKMVRLILGKHDEKMIDDAVDALAIALVTAQITSRQG